MQATLNAATRIPFIDLPQDSQSFPQDLIRRTEGIAYRVFNSPLLHTTLSAGGLAAAAIVVLTGVVSLPSSIFGPAAVISLIGIAVLYKKNEHKIWFELSLLCVRVESAAVAGLSCLFPQLSKRNWYDEINLPANHQMGSKLYLGAIPLATMLHHKELAAFSKDRSFSILTVLQPFENGTSGLVGDPVRPEDWKHLAIHQKQVEIFDLQPISADQIDEGVDFIHDRLQNSHVYVHCKAGRGRSAMMVIGYLMKHHREAVEQRAGRDFVQKTIEFVRLNRPQIYLSSKQIEALYAYEKKLQNDEPVLAQVA